MSEARARAVLIRADDQFRQGRPLVTPVPPQDPWVQVAEVLRLIRTGEAQTRPELADATSLGRNVVTLRVQAAHELGRGQPAWRRGAAEGDGGGRQAVLASMGGRARGVPDGLQRCGDPGRRGFFTPPAGMLLRRDAARSWPALALSPAASRADCSTACTSSGQVAVSFDQRGFAFASNTAMLDARGSSERTSCA